MLGALAFSVALQAATPYTLPIGRPGMATAESGRMTRLIDGVSVSPDDVAKAADGKRFVFLGENHATPAHQAMQASIVEALVRRGRKVVIGLEMLQRPKQSALDAYIAGKSDEATFLTDSDWKTQWGFDFAFYRPVFDSAKRHRLPMVALNVPRDWVRAVGRGGLSALPAEAKGQLPEGIDPNVADHRKVFEALMGGHPMTGPAGDNMLAAQTIWDEGMADSALRFLGPKVDRKTVFVVLAGSGHVMYGQGINLRLARRGQDPGITVVMTESSEPVAASKGLADFFYVSPKPRS